MFKLIYTQVKLWPVLNSWILCLWRKNYRYVLILQYTQTQIKVRLLFLIKPLRSAILVTIEAKIVFLIFFESASSSKKLHHVSYLPKGYLWTKGEKNWFFDFCCEIQILLGFWWYLLLRTYRSKKYWLQC